MKSFLVCFLITGLVFCQSSNKITYNYQKADSIANLFPGESIQNLPTLVYGLTAQLDNDFEKFRAIFTWVSTHIANDYRSYKRTESKQGRFKDDHEKYLEWNKTYLPKVYKRLIEQQKTTCTGYAYLIKQMANLAGLECVIIDGFAKTTMVELNHESRPNHSWNAAKLSGKWYLCDATWSAGRVNFIDDIPSFEFDFSDGYFLPSTELFALNHYPLDKKWLLLEKPFSFEEFLESPMVYKSAFELEIRPQLPKKMLLESTIHIPIKFQFFNRKEIDKSDIKLFIVCNSSANLIVPAVQIRKNRLLVDHHFKRKGLYDVHLMVNEKVVATYVVDISKNSSYP